MPFISAGDGDLKTAFVSDAWLLDQFVGNTLWMVGVNGQGQIGDNTIVSKSIAVQTIAQGNNWKQISCGNSTTLPFTAAIKTDGTLWMWGSNTSGKLGDNTGTNRSSPVQTVTFATNWKQVCCGANHVAAIKTDGTLWCWGTNANGALGDNTVTVRSSPIQTITRGNTWKQVSAGRNFTAAVKTDGTLWLWGVNVNGQIGDNSATTKSSPVQTVTFATNWKQVSCGYQHTAAVKTDGTLWCWGWNNNGQLGDNTSTDRSSPVQTVTAGTNWKQVACGYTFTACTKTDGTLWLWGRNLEGQLGDNTAILKSSPVQTVTYGTNWKNVGISSGSFATSAIKNDGTLWVWGYNAGGQIGDGTATTRSSPVQTYLGGNNWKQSSASVYASTTVGIVGAVTNGDI